MDQALVARRGNTTGTEAGTGTWTQTRTTRLGRIGGRRQRARPAPRQGRGVWRYTGPNPGLRWPRRGPNLDRAELGGEVGRGFGGGARREGETRPGRTGLGVGAGGEFGALAGLGTEW